jgi:hypothetical protein
LTNKEPFGKEEFIQARNQTFAGGFRLEKALQDERFVVASGSWSLMQRCSPARHMGATCWWTNNLPCFFMLEVRLK